MHVKYTNSAGTDKKCHCNQTIIIAEDIVGKFYCSSQNISDVWQCQFFHMGGLMHSNAQLWYFIRATGMGNCVTSLCSVLLKISFSLCHVPPLQCNGFAC